MAWQFRIIRDGKDRYSVRQVDLDDSGNVVCWSARPVIAAADSITLLRWMLTSMVEALAQPTLDEAELASGGELDD